MKPPKREYWRRTTSETTTTSQAWPEQPTSPTPMVSMTMGFSVSTDDVATLTQRRFDALQDDMERLREEMQVGFCRKPKTVREAASRNRGRKSPSISVGPDTQDPSASERRPGGGGSQKGEDGELESFLLMLT